MTTPWRTGSEGDVDPDIVWLARDTAVWVLWKGAIERRRGMNRLAGTGVWWRRTEVFYGYLGPRARVHLRREAGVLSGARVHWLKRGEVEEILSFSGGPCAGGGSDARSRMVPRAGLQLGECRGSHDLLSSKLLREFRLC